MGALLEEEEQLSVLSQVQEDTELYSTELLSYICNRCIAVFSCKYFSWVCNTHEIFLLSNISQTTVLQLRE